MRLTRRIALVSLTLSVLGLGQPTFADSSNDNYSTSGQQTECSGGPSDNFRLGGQVVNRKTFTLSDLQSLPSSEVTVSFLTGQGQETRTYVGVPLWQLIESVGGLKPNPDPSVKNNLLRQYVVLEATDCYQVVLAVGEIQPNFENKQVLVAYATNDDPSLGPQLLTNEGFARLVVPGDARGGRYISNIRRIYVLSAPDFRFKR
ncbi:molybdopterin-dependent oxidoreductase [Scytonema sp. UIC 10036]|uniref:molybdopterin-dependent oxidoreductase n=1 Tax=Scytonema sp. UIC 10036 TaxID=2304196 RepID=UPI0012DA2A3C|nr:molybdopterin-dependent oxidoreductase [Scytonema sp. UIC 10036]MUG93484.1 molybdopterin-dependent oxidoreductase [Scytonema sp. UIC 10036]